jgi:hypothetical protein
MAESSCAGAHARARAPVRARARLTGSAVITLFASMAKWWPLTGIPQKLNWVSYTTSCIADHKLWNLGSRGLGYDRGCQAPHTARQILIRLCRIQFIQINCLYGAHHVVRGSIFQHKRPRLLQCLPKHTVRYLHHDLPVL